MKTSFIVLAVVAGACVVLYTWAHWPIRCPACGEPFDTVDARERHLRIAHNT